MSEADPRITKLRTDEEVEGAPAAAVTAEEVPEVEVKPRRRWGRILIMLSVPLILVGVGLYFWLTSGRFVSTDNAYVQQDMVSVSTEVNGPIAEVLVHDNQYVHRGDVLFRIDQRPYRIALAQAEAQIAAAQVQVNQTVVRTHEAAPDIKGAEDNLQFAQRSFERYQTLMSEGFTTRVAFDQARHDVEEARQRLANARAEAATAQAAVAPVPVDNQPAIQAARVAREQALLNLARTEVRAPADGFVTQVDRLQVGNAAVTGVPLLTIVRSGTTYVEANYKETDLANMAVGQPATIELDAYPGIVIRGHVDSLGRGTGSQFSILPAQNANGNWVKVTQRVPVRIAIDGDPGRPMIAGLSASVSIDIREHPAQPPGQAPAPAQPPAPAAAPQR
jgi:membrane fusion protein, multidrug efflux system